MYTVILPTIIKTCLHRFNFREHMFILCQIQRDGFLFADEGWSDYYLKNDIRFSTSSLVHEQHQHEHFWIFNSKCHTYAQFFVRRFLNKIPTQRALCAARCGCQGLFGCCSVYLESHFDRLLPPHYGKFVCLYTMFYV